MSVAFTQELLFAHGLGAQAQALSRQNAQLTAANQGYAQDIADVASGAAAEEEARQNGYARSDEKVYLLSQTAPSRAPASPSPAAPVPHP
ncbi:MAG: septum formation initiator family protein, partial [Candidatus Dormibacteraceae bacterium]